MQHPLQNKIHRFICGDHGDFEEIALELFSWQFEHILPYQNYVRALGKTPTNVDSWQEIPAIPTDAFKHKDLPLISENSRPVATFKTSGTTTSKRGEHHFPDLRIYHQSILSAWIKLEPLKVEHAFFLSNPPAESPNSSLINMFAVLQEKIYHTTKNSFLQENDILDPTPLRQFLIQNNEPIILMGTALAFLHLLENHAPISLPPDSHILETGGYKNSQRSLEKDELYHQLKEFFQIPTKNIINEYSMTELSSQAYTRGLNQPHHLPPWCRAQVIDPGKRGGGGSTPILNQPGYLILHDLANLHSVAAIRTQDFAISHDYQTFTLIGRDPAALARGCSLTAEDLQSPTFQK